MMLLLLLLAQMSFAQEDVARGAKIFAQSCAVGYCHGSGGAANRGPRLAGRGFDRKYLVKVIAEGLPGTAMPGFRATLKDDGLAAVVAYVLSLSGGAAPATAAPAYEPSAEPPKFEGPPEARAGKDLFFDAVRGVRCGTCHVAGEWGVAVGPNPAQPNITASAIRSARGANVRTAVVGADRFPALLVEQKDDFVRVYDLTSAPPVLRNLLKSEVRFEAGSSWSHAAAIQSYKDADLDRIAAYLRWLAR
jgi:mono/diheme cytochrome c family protein